MHSSYKYVRRTRVYSIPKQKKNMYVYHVPTEIIFN